jgi:spore germination cell wall hydrolase CwlJ-like protein
MTRFLTLLVGIFLLSMTPLNSNSTNKIWVAPKAPIFNNNKIPTTLLDIPNQHLDYNKSADLVLTDPQELECMTMNIYFEAALESTAGKLAVAQVTLNRVKSNHYPNTVCSVVKQGRHHESGFPVRDRCQFSWYCDGKLDIPSMGKMWGQSREVAVYVLKNTQLLDITDGATHYHADYIDSPRWASVKDRTMQIDTHIFYNKHKKRHL